MTAPVIPEAAVVVVSRHWHYPAIRVAISRDDIALTIGLDDFTRALAAELGSPVSIFTKAQLLERLTTAAASVVAGIKEASAAAPPPPSISE